MTLRAVLAGVKNCSVLQIFIILSIWHLENIKVPYIASLIRSTSEKNIQTNENYLSEKWSQYKLTQDILGCLCEYFIV